MNEALIKHLEKFATENRVNVFNRIIKNRTRYITVVLEDLYQSHNASAVLRTCECFGIQDVHIIENTNKFSTHPDIALGSDKWLTLVKYSHSTNNSLDAINDLREKGYRIVATTPHHNDTLLEEFNLDTGKVALFFGTELQGLSGYVLKEADEYLKIPMFGFTESFNISVTAALILHTLTTKLRSSAIQWKLTQHEKQEVKLAWLKKSIKNADLIEKQFLAAMNN
jgi:tRNA (guanosine-2'-O-)-methyltransferase